MTKYCIFLLVAGALSLTGCVGMAVSAVNPELGRSRVSETVSLPKEKCFAMMVDAVKTTALEIVSTDDASGRISAKSGVSLTSWGEKVEVVVSVVDADHTQVEVITERNSATNITAKNWTNTLINQLLVRANFSQRVVGWFTAFQGRPTPRVFFIADQQSASWAKTEKRALQICAERKFTHCRLLAKDNDLIVKSAIDAN